VGCARACMHARSTACSHRRVVATQACCVVRLKGCERKASTLASPATPKAGELERRALTITDLHKHVPATDVGSAAQKDPTGSCNGELTP